MLSHTQTQTCTHTNNTFLEISQNNKKFIN